MRSRDCRTISCDVVRFCSSARRMSAMLVSTTVNGRVCAESVVLLAIRTRAVNLRMWSGISKRVTTAPHLTSARLCAKLSGENELWRTHVGKHRRTRHAGGGGHRPGQTVLRRETGTQGIAWSGTRRPRVEDRSHENDRV